MESVLESHGCQTCPRSFGTRLGLEMHAVRVHHRRAIPDGPDVSADTSDSSTPPSVDVPDAGSESAECPECGGSFADDEAVGDHLEAFHRPAPMAPPTEDESVREVADGLPKTYGILALGSDRLSRVRDILASARRKAARHPDRDADGVIRMFWDGSDRRVLESLRSKGVDLLASASVGDGTSGG